MSPVPNDSPQPPPPSISPNIPAMQVTMIEADTSSIVQNSESTSSSNGSDNKRGKFQFLFMFLN